MNVLQITVILFSTSFLLLLSCILVQHKNLMILLTGLTQNVIKSLEIRQLMNQQ